MIVSIHQPAYLPWLGYLARIATSDAFIFLDTVQFEKNSFSNRNRIKTANGPLWLTVPVHLQGHTRKPMTEIEVDNRQDWRKKHLRSIEQSYRRAPGFVEKFPKFAALLEREYPRLADMCYDQLCFWLGELGIRTRVLRASQLPVTGQKSDLVLALCQHVGTDTYLSGPFGRGYLDEVSFGAAGITIRYHDYVHPEYPQLYGPFEPAMSVVDYWMNCPDNEIFREKA